MESMTDAEVSLRLDLLAREYDSVMREVMRGMVKLDNLRQQMDPMVAELKRRGVVAE